MSRSARELLESLTDDDVAELDHVLTAACMSAAFHKDPRRVFKAEKKKHKGRMRRMLNAFHKAGDLPVILNNHYLIMEQQREKLNGVKTL